MRTPFPSVLRRRFRPAWPRWLRFALLAGSLLASLVSCGPAPQGSGAPAGTGAEALGVSRPGDRAPGFSGASGAPLASVPSGKLAAGPDLVPWERVSEPGQGVASSGFPVLAVDGDPTTEWNPRAFSAPEAPQWLAVPLRSPARGELMAVWHGHGLHYQVYGYGRPRSYDLEASADSRDGEGGTWRTVAQVRDNPVRSRADRFSAPGARWVRLRFTDVWARDTFEPFIRELAVYEAKRPGASDCWLILGDSTTSVAFDPAGPSVFSEVVESRHPGYTPVCLSGGTGGDTAADVLVRLDQALPTLPPHSVVGLHYGSNDAARGVPLEAYRASLQAAIERIRAAGHQPLLAVQSWNLNGQIAEYARVCREVSQANGLPPGPDFYRYFQAHPEELATDKVHPNAAGIRSTQRLWAEAADFRYPAKGD